MDVIFQIAENVIRTNFPNLSSRVVDLTKYAIMDTLAVAIAGSSAPGCLQVFDQVTDWAGREESTIWVWGKKVPSFHAAMVNGTLSHARDFDDTHDPAGVHACGAVLPAALAVAEREGRVGGRELITAVALGVDLACRLGLSMRLYPGWHFVGICGALGAAAAVGKILGFDRDKLIHAFGIVYGQAAGNLQALLDGAMTKRMQPGFAARSAVLSGYLAAEGITGPQEVLQGEYGFFNLFEAYDEERSPREQIRFTDAGQKYGQHHLTADLGQRFEIENLGFKPYPCGRASHGIIGATIKNVVKNEIKPEEIEKVDVAISPWISNLMGRPFKITENFLIDAQFSAIYHTAAAILRKDLFLDSFTEEAIKDPKIAELAAKIELIIDPQIKHKVPITVKIRTKAGQVYSETVHTYKGMPEDPFTPEEFREKFRKCVRFSIKPMVEEQVESMIERIEKLDDIEEIGELTNLFI